MAAVISSKHGAAYDEERRRLLSYLLAAVKQCQIRFGDRTELATESDRIVFDLCKCFEAVLSHGLRNRPLQKNSSTFEQVTGIVANTFRYTREALCFWHYVREHLNKHEIERFSSLKEISSDMGRGRAWLRSALNERSLSRHMKNFLLNAKEAATYYHDWSLLLNQELSAALPDIAAKLNSILFAISINDKRLNDEAESFDDFHFSKSEPILAMPIEVQAVHRRRRAAAQVISFENDAEDEGLPDSYSAPATCILSSSAQSASILCSVTPTEQKSFDYFDTSKKLDETSHSSNDSSFQEFEAPNKIKAVVEEKPADVRTLIPLTDSNIGELIVVTGEKVPQAFTVNCTDSDDEKVEDLLNVQFKESVRPEDLETALNSLEEVKDMNAKLKAQILTLTQQKKDENSKLQFRLQALTRENEVLKHQLRKYVEAVQMLNKDGSAAHEALACLEANREISRDDRDEARQYEKKLVLIAEMHGELIEFNDRLQKVIQSKENIIKRLERELTDLRGPLPGTSLWEEGIIAVPETLINICIPSAFLTGGSSDVHHVYQVCVRIRDTEWNVYRRYSQFYNLHKDLKKEYAVVGSLDFPPKKTVGNKDAKFVEERRIRLQRYLRQVVDIVSKYRMDLVNSTSLTLIIPFFSVHLDNDKSQSGQRTRFGRRKNAEVAAVSNIYDSSQYNGL